MKSILLHIREDTGQEARLQAALDVARAAGGHLTCVQATPITDFVINDAFGGVYMLPDVLDKIVEGEEAERERIERRLAAEGVPFDWLRFTGNVPQVIVGQARLADLTVLSSGVSEPAIGDPLPLTADVAIHSRTPVLAVPSDLKRFDATGPALVAWNGAFEAANALRAALPMLRQSASVEIVAVEEETDDFPATDASVYLSRHGVRSEIRRRPRGGDSVADALSAAIAELQPAYVVMGAYGHSRAREYLLGGVTRHLLGTAPVPLFLAH